MYSNSNKKGFSILDLIVKIILAGLFIFILIWLFNKKVPNMKPFYSNVFRENIKYMQEAGENYFTDDRMPSEIGESKKISLKEMIDTNLVLPFVDKDGKECNVDESYVSITKLEEGYELKTNLVCPKETNYTIKMLGCHNYCPTGTCNPEKEETEPVCSTEKITQYQFKKLVTKTSSTYSCASGYKLKGKYCYKTTLVDSKPAEERTVPGKEERIPATPIVVGGEKISLTPIVTTETVTTPYVKTQLTTLKTTSTSTADYIKTKLDTVVTTTTVPRTCTKYRDERKCTTHDETRSYSCNCTSSVGPTGKTITTCSTCYYTVPVETCKTVSVPYTDTCYDTVKKYSCPSGTTIQEGKDANLKCYKTSCPSGYTGTGSGAKLVCKKTTTTYSCPTGTTIKEGSGANLKCYKTSCPSGYTGTGSGTSLVCKKTNKKYSCPKDANLQEGSGANLKCYKVTEGKITYSCSKQYRLEGKECVRTISGPTTEYYCKSGYKLEDKKCNKYNEEKKKATEKKVTTKKYEYKWSDKTSLSGWERTGKTRTVDGKKTCK